MGSQSVHSLFGWLFGRHEPQKNDWLHQRPRPQYNPEHQPVIGGARTRAWVASQLRAMGYEDAPEQPQRNTGAITPIPPIRETGEMQQLALPAPKPLRPQEANDTLSPLPGLPKWLVAAVPDGRALPVLRQQSANPASTPGQIAANSGALDSMLTTLGSARDRYRLDLPAYQDLPTAPSQGKMVSDALNALPPPTPLPDTVVEAFSADAFLLAPPVLQEMDEESTASADKISNPLGVTMTDMQPDLSEDVEGTAQASALIKLKFCEHEKKGE